MVGVVLTGGESRRMGSDKGLLTNGSVTWAGIAAANLRAVANTVYLSVNPQQLPSYSEIFEPAILVADDYRIQVRGPLLGILSVHRRLPGEDLFVLACDMPLMAPAVLTRLLSAYVSSREYEAYVFSIDGLHEPVCAIYTAQGLLRIYRSVEDGQLSAFSLKSVLEILQTCVVPVEAGELPYFQNFNAPLL